MKRIISLMLVFVCVMSLVLSGCEKQEIEPVTVGEILDLLKAEGYTDIQHEEGSHNYTLVDSGSSKDEDENDIFIRLLTYENKVLTHESKEEHTVQEIDLSCDFFTEEFESLSRYILTYITKDTESVNEIISSTQTEIIPMIEKRKYTFFGFRISSDDQLEEMKSSNPNRKRYTIELMMHY